MAEVFDIVMRIVHIGSAIALLGGTLFFIVVMLPSIKVVDEGLRQSIVDLARKRFYRISHPAIILLLITGFYNYVSNMELYKAANKAVHAVIGIKIMLALVIVAILFGQTFKLITGCPKRWAKVSLALGAVIVILAAVARAMRLGAI